MKPPVVVSVTGAAGQIGYALVFRIASGQLLGPDQPVILKLLEITPALDALDGVIMELHDCAFELLHDVQATDDPAVAFGDTSAALLVGSRPRGPGMERKDLLQANAAIFSVQGRALDKAARKDVRILVVGNPANTNCLIAQHNAPNLSPRQFSAMTRLDHNRAKAQLAQKTSASVDQIKRLCIWGNHSSTQYPDITNALVGGQPAVGLVEESWISETFIPAVQQRGAAIIKARGASSAASAANAAIEHLRDWLLGSGGEDVISMGICSDGSHGIAPGLVYSFPCHTEGGEWRIEESWDIGEESRKRMRATEAELIEERDAVRHLLP